MAHKKEKVVYLVRHGQSIHNASPVFQSVDSALSEKGLKQAGELADRLSKLKFDALISSPVLRAEQTAKVISGKTGMNIDFSELFVERIKPTTIDGKSWEDPEASKVWRNWEESLFTPGLRVEDGENYDDINARAKLALNYLNNRPEQAMVVVTHGYFLRAIVANVLIGEQMSGEIMKNFQRLSSVENTGITVLHYRDAFEEDFCWRLWTHNDHAHFAE